MDGIKSSGVDLYDYYVKDTKAFRKRIRECKNAQELGDFLSAIATANSSSGSQFTYKVACDNKWGVSFEDIDIDAETGRIRGYFYLHGGRKFKDIKSFSYKARLVKFSYWDRSFGITIY